MKTTHILAFCALFSCAACSGEAPSPASTRGHIAGVPGSGGASADAGTPKGSGLYDLPAAFASKNPTPILIWDAFCGEFDLALMGDVCFFAFTLKDTAEDDDSTRAYLAITNDYENWYLNSVVSTEIYPTETPVNLSFLDSSYDGETTAKYEQLFGEYYNYSDGSGYQVGPTQFRNLSFFNFTNVEEEFLLRHDPM